jgi:predicted RNA methylase
LKRILKSELDKFYTKPELAKYLINKIDLSKYELVVDPCCGDGSFYNNINCNKIGIDILPGIEGVIRHDFLIWDFNYNIDSKKVLTLSNPPFGKQGSLAMNFIKKSLEFSDTIAFILPLSFAKDSVKNKVPEYLHLEYEEILPEESFLLNNDNYSVKCVFQIWVRKDYKREKIKTVKEIGFSYTNNKDLADFSVRRVGVYAGKAFLDCDKSKQSHYFIILNNKEKINSIIENLNNNVWNDLTVGPRSISKSELNSYINSILNK